MASRTTITTSLGKVWVTEFDSGDIALWWPKGAAVGAMIVALFAGRAAWQPTHSNWIVSLRYADAVRREIAVL